MLSTSFLYSAGAVAVRHPLVSASQGAEVGLVNGIGDGLLHVGLGQLPWGASPASPPTHAIAHCSCLRCPQDLAASRLPISDHVPVLARRPVACVPVLVGACVSVVP